MEKTEVKFRAVKSCFFCSHYKMEQGGFFGDKYYCTILEKPIYYYSFICNKFERYRI